MRRLARSSLVIAALVLLYLLLPAGAGSLKIGDRLGPVPYPRDYHQLVYRIGYSIVGHGKPRIPFDSILHQRPLFYGLERRLFSEFEAQAFFDEQRQKGNDPDEFEAMYEALKVSHE